ncbi:MAG TPA: thioesterase domain-containing protein, partial [Methylomirabilota bacterium]|nr:thioesterase domain-containing protein [Methylomirabilota bacterium]
AGGGAAAYRTWTAELPAEVEVCALRLPGREDRLTEPPFRRLGPLVAALVPGLRPHLDRPFAFFGHSMGALVAFHTAHAVRHYQSPVHLFVSGRRAPHVPSAYPPIHALPDAEFVRQLRRLNGTPEAVLCEPQLMDMLLPVLRADIAVSETYVYAPQPPLDCPISAFGGVRDSEAGHDELAAWRDHTRAVFTLRMLPGDHFFLHTSRPPLLRALGEEVARWL